MVTLNNAFLMTRRVKKQTNKSRTYITSTKSYKRKDISIDRQVYIEWLKIKLLNWWLDIVIDNSRYYCSLFYTRFLNQPVGNINAWALRCIERQWTWNGRKNSAGRHKARNDKWVGSLGYGQRKQVTNRTHIPTDDQRTKWKTSVCVYVRASLK